jgi:hypothetical protein
VSHIVAVLGVTVGVFALAVWFGWWIVLAPADSGGSPANPRWAGAASVAALLGCLAVLPWLFITAIEVDTGWEDAIWSDAPWNFYAWALSILGVIAASCAFVSARRYRKRGAQRALRLCVLCLGVEVAAGAGWVAIAYAAVSP